VSDPQAEENWLREAQAGSALAFARLVRLHQQALRHFLRRYCGNLAEADDIAQETFLFAWGAMGRFRTGGNFRAWLMGIGYRKASGARRAALRLLRRQSRALATSDAALADPDLRLDLTAALRGLPPSQRAAVLLCLGGEFTHAEAAEALDIPRGTIKSHVTRGREKLLAALGGSDARI
jgi:RNA polymerase sigma-70 factor (ECF subfamily)